MFPAVILRRTGNVHFVRAIMQVGFPGGAAEPPGELLHSTLSWLRQFAQVYRQHENSEQSQAVRQRSDNPCCGRGLGLSEEQEKLKQNKRKALARSRRGRQLFRKAEQKEVPYWRLSWNQKALLDEFGSGRLAIQVDKAAKEYGFGMARTSDFIPAGQCFDSGQAAPFRMSFD